jgi:hypothetical protein
LLFLYPERSEGSLLSNTLLIGLLAFVASAFCNCQIPRPNAPSFHDSFTAGDELLRIQDRDFIEMKAVEALPTPVKTALAASFGQSRLRMANPGEDFNPGDVVDSYPTRRLILAGCSQDRCVVHYEKGGRGLQYLAILFKLDDKQNAGVLWAANYLAPAHDLQQLREHQHSAKDQRSSY